MSVVIKTIKDYFNNYVYPKTKTKAVYDDSNNRLDNTLASVVHFDNDSSTGTISDPVLKQSDIATTLGTSDTVPASQKLVNTVNTNLGSPSSASSVTGADAFAKISTLNSDLASMLKSKYVEITDLTFTAGSSIDLGTVATATGISGLTYSGIKGLSLLMAGGNQNFDFGNLYCNRTNGHMYYRPTTTQSSAFVFFTVLY